MIDVTMCDDYYKQVLEFAEKIGKKEQLLEQLDRLERMAMNRKGKIFLSKDFAPYSFYWILRRNDSDVIMNGGLIFHGSHDCGGYGGAPTFSVNLTPVDGWSIHT